MYGIVPPFFICIYLYRKIIQIFFDMEKRIVQIENLQADEILSRLEKMESAIIALGEQKKPISKNEAAEFVTRADVSRMLKVSIVTVSDWTRKGILTAYKCGNRVYFKRSEVEAALIKKGGTYAH